MKVIAFYLPQFHTIPENDEWWGKGFTEWINVKKATPLFDGHHQPKIPLNDNYYNLLDDDVKMWQADLAKKYGIYGFCYYHYWYNGKMLLEKPMEQMLANKRIDIPFCIWWCNHAWTKAWVGDDKKVLISQKYGDKSEWIEHYNYLRKFFLDKRYILNNNKPILGIYNPVPIINISDMKDCWNTLAKKDGFDGIDLMCSIKSYSTVKTYPNIYDYFDHFVEWGFSLAAEKDHISSRSKIKSLLVQLKNVINFKYEKTTGHSLTAIDWVKEFRARLNNNKTIKKYDYDKIWNYMISIKPYSKKSIPAAFVNWDNTARYGINGSVMVNDSPVKFEKYLSKQIDNAKKNYNCDMIFLAAWNEWSEWSVLEPDQENGYAYLEAVKNALINNNEFPSVE